MTLASILVIDPDVASRTLISSGLRELGHDVSETGDAGAALESVRRHKPDLLVCDWLLPDLSGVELVSDVRRNDELRSIRVMMTSASAEPDDAVSALQCGADDFVAKPLHMPEFIARVVACLRRPAGVFEDSVVNAGGIAVDTIGHRVSVDGKYLLLAPREYQLLLFLLRNPDRVFSRRQLLLHVWKSDAIVGPRTVDVHVRRLRSFLEPYGYNKYLQTVRGSGYRFSLEP